MSDEKTAASQPTDGGILANDHDVDKLGEEVNKLVQGLAQRGVLINLNLLDMNNLRSRIESAAALHILVAKGICTGAEMAAACNAEFKAILSAILQIVEEQQAQAQQAEPRADKIIVPEHAGKVQAVKPKLAVVRH